MKSNRNGRVNSEIQKLVYDIIKNQINVPTITEMFSITDVDVAPDLKSAKIYLSVYSTNEEKAKITFDSICNSSSEIRKCLASKMRIRYVPELRFYKDSSFEYGDKIDKLLSQITYGDNNDDKWNCKRNFKI